ncbi:protein of unknown function - conserved [Leishmania donovani]|uniref:Uncharacterized protein n=3 Tax=Leishmania donovani species complex TaxID=38574 RepID=A4I9C1_LEIIN|nr:conserved hypothetical protein [Leishmania infantum JPCM5]XP_003864118.1 hypothetical protein, conserved [Leishmania donovani]CAC9534287.1 hypothetical_protein_-_conserved [Leishmania infantum]AYU82276.1 hypothetical protein LdCL_330036500 [Leishmania donovani]TPP53587.1 hypothetical protein CGC21_37190 [Leishmania donovani]CAJ1992282.1 protein of unknown function - conserved [Leishmania donovani]CAM71424.1 conserved hypothetical protein [Leishmania infantum JPCM5]|eukprot:XP_001468340.1 conserved hypothetical protein [Leishmania infantum JPCM5]
MSTAQAAIVKRSSSALQRLVVDPLMNVAHKIEGHSAKKMQSMEPAMAEWIKAQEATGSDAATISRQRFLREQHQLMSYRVVRFFEECRYIASGQYYKNYSIGCFLQDARFATQAFFIFLMAVMAGRRSVYPPISPNSPLAIALDHKVNPNY